MSAMPETHSICLAPSRFRRIITAAVLFAATSVLAQQPNGAGWIPFAEGEDRPAIEVTINGKETIALIDTSISANAVSTEFAREAGIEPGPQTRHFRDIQGGKQLPLSGKFTLELAGNPVELEHAVLMPARGAGLIIGRPLLNVMVLQIDYPNRRLRFLPPDAAEFEGNVKIRRGRFNQPMIETHINGKRIWMMLDTSNKDVCLLTDRVVDKHGWSGPEVSVEKLRAAGLAVRSDVRTMRLDLLELGPFDIQDVIVAKPTGESPDAQHYGAHRIHEKFGGDGILGYEIMRHFLVTMALGNDTVHLYPQ
ncbi:MAG: aspartyl protease family protein [Wenzhouxiangellaceae bacterium]|nr:aspartyl protease family protein [Wenzhouxiangellaceae bacterium]